GRGRVERDLTRVRTALGRAEKLVGSLPLRGRQAAFGAALEEKRELAERAFGYVELYGAYAECEAIYGLDNLFALWDSLDSEDQQAFAFDPRVIDWPSYVQDVHLP